MTTFHNFALKIETGWAAMVVKPRKQELSMYLVTLYFPWHEVLSWSLKSQWFLNFNYVLLIKKLAEGLEILSSTFIFLGKIFRSTLKED